MKYNNIKNNFKMYILIFKDIYLKIGIPKEFYLIAFSIILKEKIKKLYYNIITIY